MARPLVRGTVLRARSGFYTVQTDTGPLECQLRGRLKRERATSELAVIGDTVVVRPLGDGIGAIEGVMPRLTSFGRRHPGPRGTWRQDLLVANVDRVLVVFACSDPIPHLRMVDRFLVAAEHNQIPAVLIVNKVDLCGEPAARKLFARYEKASYEVHYVSGRTSAGVDPLRDLLGGHISVFTGPSGVGKSTLLNVIQPGMSLATASVSNAIHKGRHTTVAAELLPLEGPRGGWVADTPGLREIGLWALPDAELAWCFPDIRPHLGGCAFNDCRHLGEPRCAVRAAVSTGQVAAERYDSYRRLLLGDG